MTDDPKKAFFDGKLRAVTLFGMSGVGKTRIAALLRDSGDWFHYSVDYRIGTRYLGEEIVDEFRLEAMKNPKLRELVQSDSIFIASNLSFHNLRPLSNWLGKPGSPRKHGISFEEYLHRQRIHRDAEISAMLDYRKFLKRSKRLYRYGSFVCDTSGSFCEVVDPTDKDDPILGSLYRDTVIVYIRGTEKHRREFARRFSINPKPMYYNEAFLIRNWSRYLGDIDGRENEANPDDFSRQIFDRVLDYRLPIYQEIADRWGITVEADEVFEVETEAEFCNLVEKRISER